MKNALVSRVAPPSSNPSGPAAPSPTEAVMPDGASLAALRAWYEGLSTTDSVQRYLPHAKVDGRSSRGLISAIRRQLMAVATARRRPDLAALFNHPEAERKQHARAVAQAIELLPTLQVPQPMLGDDIAQWLPPRAVRVLQAAGIKTLAALTLRVPRRRRWWSAVPGLGPASAKHIEAFFAAHPDLTERARALIAAESDSPIVPWERLAVPTELDGSRGTFRGNRALCVVGADDDKAAVEAWLANHETPATQRAYRKEAERLMLWAIVERRQPLSSLTNQDAVAYRSFLRQPSPRGRWIGPVRPRLSAEWRPFTGPLSARSVAYSMSVLASLFHWLVEKNYLAANPFSGIKVQGGARDNSQAAQRVFHEGEWSMIQTVSEALEWTHGWSPEAAQRVRFVMDFAYATGLRPTELIDARLGHIEVDAVGDYWLKVNGKGSKKGKVALPPLARSALDRYLVQRGLPTTVTRWDPKQPLVASVHARAGQEGGKGSEWEERGQPITATRLWAIMKRLFNLVASQIEDINPAAAQKLRNASPHWMRHTHATHALARGADLTVVRDNLRHASLTTTSVYLHTEEVKRARQMGEAFKARQ